MTKTIKVCVWCCPTDGCGNFFGSSSTPDLRKEQVRRDSMLNLAEEPPENWGQVLGTRAECPDCKERGIKVERVPVSAQLVLSE